MNIGLALSVSVGYLCVMRRNHGAVTVLFDAVCQSSHAAISIMPPSDILNGDGLMSDLSEREPQFLVGGCDDTGGGKVHVFGSDAVGAHWPGDIDPVLRPGGVSTWPEIHKRQSILKSITSRGWSNRLAVRCLVGFRRCGVLWFTHDF